MQAGPASASVERAVVKKAAARTAGAKKYFTGQPCKNGHVSERWVSCGSCLSCQAVTKEKLKAWSLEYARAWRANNREKANSYAAKWRAKNPSAGAAYMAKRRAADRPGMLAAARTIYAGNPEKFRAKCRAYLRANKVKVALYARARRAIKAAAEGRHTECEIKTLASAQRHRCAYCKASIKTGFHADHIIPLVAGGSNWIRNIQLLCPTCNMRKGAKDPIAFSQQEGRLL